MRSGLKTYFGFAPTERRNSFWSVLGATWCVAATGGSLSRTPCGER
jgi:hypothetical protein